METAPSPEITRLLRAWGGGDRAALDQLTPLVYQELHRMAHRHMQREQPGHTLQTSALVNEAYLRLVDAKGIRWQDRAHFFAVSAQMMRRILVDAAKARLAGKRGGLSPHVNLDEFDGCRSGAPGRTWWRLTRRSHPGGMDPRKARVVELRFFGGMSVEETAEAVGISPQSVMRDWKLAKAWLTREMKGGAE